MIKITYNVRTDGGGIWIDYEIRHPDKLYTKEYRDCRIYSELSIEKYDIILSQAENIVLELNRLKDSIESLETDLTMCQTPEIFYSVESKRVIDLERKLMEKKSENNHLVNTIYRKIDEFFMEKRKL